MTITTIKATYDTIILPPIAGSCEKCCSTWRKRDYTETKSFLLQEAEKVVQEIAVHDAEEAGKVEAGLEAEIAATDNTTTLVSPATTRGGTAAKAFQRVKAEEWLNKKAAKDNSYAGTFGGAGWGAKAQEVLGKVKFLCSTLTQHNKSVKIWSVPFGFIINRKWTGSFTLTYWQKQEMCLVQQRTTENSHRCLSTGLQYVDGWLQVHHQYYAHPLIIFMPMYWKWGYCLPHHLKCILNRDVQGDIVLGMLSSWNIHALSRLCAS